MKSTLSIAIGTVAALTLEATTRLLPGVNQRVLGVISGVRWDVEQRKLVYTFDRVRGEVTREDLVVIEEATPESMATALLSYLANTEEVKSGEARKRVPNSKEISASCVEEHEAIKVILTVPSATKMPPSDTEEYMDWSTGKIKTRKRSGMPG